MQFGLETSPVGRCVSEWTALQCTHAARVGAEVPMVKHIVFFRFKPEVPKSEREQFLQMLRGLPEQIEEIADFQAGHDVVRRERSYDMALVSSFVDLAALDRYAKHDHHQPVIRCSRELCSSVVSVDFEY